MKASSQGLWGRIEDIFFPRKTSGPPRAKLADLYDEAHEQYDIKPYPGELTLFFAERHLAGFNVPLGGWQGVAEGGVRYYSLPCSSRGSLIEPYVRDLALILRKCIDRAVAQDATDPGKSSAGLTHPEDVREVTHAAMR